MVKEEEEESRAEMCVNPPGPMDVVVVDDFDDDVFDSCETDLVPTTTTTTTMMMMMV